MNLRMDQMPKNTSILIISGAIRISAIERLSVISVECDSMCRHLKETVVKIDSAIHMGGGRFKTLYCVHLLPPLGIKVWILLKRAGYLIPLY